MNKEDSSFGNEEDKYSKQKRKNKGSTKIIRNILRKMKRKLFQRKNLAKLDNIMYNI